MRNGQNKRMRGRNRNKGHHHHHGGGHHHNPLTRVYESNGPEVKIRGTAHHVAEKYLQLARDAASSGDHVTAENHYQHAEHYFRLIAAAQEQFRQQNPYYQPQAMPGAADADQDGFEGDDDAGQGQPMQGQPTQGQPIQPMQGHPQPTQQGQPNYGNQPQPQFQPREQPQPYGAPQHHQQGRPHYQQQHQQPRHQPHYEQPPQQRPQAPQAGVDGAAASGGADALPAFITGVQQPQNNNMNMNNNNGYDAQGDRFRHRRRRRGGGGPRPDPQQGGGLQDFRDPDDPPAGNS